MSYYPSDKIKMYPSFNRDDTKDREARLYTEHNITIPNNTITDNPNYIVSGFTIDNNILSTGTCVIQGYWFKTDATINLSGASSGDYVYLKISIINGTNPLVPNPHIEGGDDNGYYKGLEVDISNTDPTSQPFIKIAKYNGSSWDRCLDCDLKFSSNKIKVNTSSLSGLGSTTTTDTTIQDFLDNFIIDDGSI